MQENTHKISSEKTAQIAERYRRELLSLYRSKNPPVPLTPAPAPSPEPVADTRPLFPQDTPGQTIVLPPALKPPQQQEAPAPAPVKDSGSRPFEMDSPDEALTADSLTGESSEGFLQVQVSTANQALPVPDAHVKIYRELGGGKVQFRQAMTTDRSGKTPTIPLPTPPAELSKHPGNFHPYSSYNIYIYADGYYPVEDVNVPIFDGIKSIQPVSLVPVEEFSENPYKTQIFYGEEPSL